MRLRWRLLRLMRGIPSIWNLTRAISLRVNNRLPPEPCRWRTNIWPSRRRKRARGRWMPWRSRKSSTTPRKPKHRKIEVVCDTLQPRDEPDFKAADELEEVVINDSYPEQKIKIGAHLSEQERKEPIEVLKANVDAFAWEVTDMRGVDPAVALHRLNVDPSFRPIQQRARQFSRDKEEAVKIEIAKLLAADIIEELQYPTWLANVVMVLKSNGK